MESPSLPAVNFLLVFPKCTCDSFDCAVFHVIMCSSQTQFYGSIRSGKYIIEFI